MTVFYCPHCHNRIEVEDSYAGRDGWCRRCKNMITVPRRDQRDIDGLSPAENYERLAKAFQHAATKADRYQGLFLKTAEEKEQLAEELQELAGLKERFEALEQKFEATRHAGEPPPGSDHVSELDVLKEEVAALATQLEHERTTFQAPIPHETGKDADLRNDVQALIQRVTAREEQDAEQDALTASAIERLRDDVEEQHRLSITADERLSAQSAEIDATRAELQELRADRETLRANVDALCAERDELRAGVSALRAESETLRAAVQAAAVVDLEARVAALEQALTNSVEAATNRANATEADIAALKNELRALSGSSSRLRDLDARTEGLDARLAASASETESIRSSIDALRSTLERLSASIEIQRSEAAGSRQTLEDAAVDAADARRTVEEERAARTNLETALDQFQRLTGAMAGELQSLRAAVDALSAIEAVPPDDESFDGVPLEEAGKDNDAPVTPEAIEGDSEAAQQTMLNSFLRFMHSQQRGKQ